MPFGLKNAPSEFQRIMNDIFSAYENKSTRRKTAGNSLPNKTKTKGVGWVVLLCIPYFSMWFTR